MRMTANNRKPIRIVENTNQRGRPTAQLTIRAGSQGTRDTLNIMRFLVKEGRKNPLIRQTALEIVENFPQKDYAREIAAIHAFVRDDIRYVRDINDVETLQYPAITLDIGQGDCDDKVILAGSLLETIGHPVRLVAIGTDPFRYTHVLHETILKNKCFSVETTENVALGWIPPGVKKRLVVPIK